MSIKNEIVAKLAFVYWSVVFFGLLILLKVVFLQVFQRSKWKERQEAVSLKNVSIKANRGDILSLDGRALASSVPYYEVRMDLKSKAMKQETFNEGLDSLAFCLSKLLYDPTKTDNRTKKDIILDLRQARRDADSYHLIARKLDYSQLKQLRKFPIFRLGPYKGGLIVVQHSERKKPFKDLASRTIGRVKNQSETKNIIGIEGAYDKLLAGTDGLRLMKKLSGNNWMPVNDNNQVEPKDGLDVVTTIDVNIQDIAENALLKQLQLHKAHHGCAIVMDVQSGEVRAIANLMDSAGIYKEYYNYAIGVATEPGSTFKLVSMICAIEDGFVKLTDSVDTQGGELDYCNFKIRDSKKGGHGIISAQQAFELSSNVGVAKLILKHYQNNPKKMIDRIYAMKLNQPLNIDIQGEMNPYIKNTKDRFWSKVSLPQMAIGYETKLTPLQILTFYNAIANNGVMVKPRFVREIRDHSKIVAEFIDPEVINPMVCSKATIAKVKTMMVGVVETGTATNIRSASYKIAGKTGTAQIANQRYGYKTSSGVSYQASFAGFFPADNPRYSCIIVVNDPSEKEYYGSTVAGPVFKEIADKIYATNLDMQQNNVLEETGAAKGIPQTKAGYYQDMDGALTWLDIPFKYLSKKTKWVNTTKKEDYVAINGQKNVKNAVPKVEGMGLRNAIMLLENAGLKVQVVGKGRVVSQSVPAGSTAKAGQVVVLKMSQG